MKTKLFLTSIVALYAVAPAFATPTNTSATFPANGYMLEDYTYTNQATYTNMGVYENSVNANADYNDCPANSWCDASGQHACSSLSGSYTLSAAGSTANTDCYKACTVATANIAHAATVTGNDYYGTGTDTCSAATCENGYHINPGTPDLNTVIGTTAGGVDNNNTYGMITNDGSYNYNGTTYGLTQNGTFATEYANNKGVIRGRAQCSSRSVANPWYDDPNFTFSSDDITSTLPDNTGQYCYCTLDSYTPVGESAITLSGPWVLDGVHSLASNCAEHCAERCADGLGSTFWGALALRAAVFGSLDQMPASCDANIITINWSNASAADIAANEAGTVTYGGDIRTPVAAEHIPGKIFVGWTFEAPAEEEH